MNQPTLSRLARLEIDLDKDTLATVKYTDGQYYHAYNRGAHQHKIFFEPPNYIHLINLLAKYSVRFGVNLVAYCLMPNHYHLVLVQNESGSIGRMLKTTFNAYTQAINNRYKKSGTLFQGQVRVKLLDSDSYCLQAIRYIHLNPWKARLVEKPEDWLYSDYAEWIGMKESSAFDASLRNAYFEGPQDYKRFVDDYLSNGGLEDLATLLEQ